MPNVTLPVQPPSAPTSQWFLARAVIRASMLHVGSAAAVSLHADLVEGGLFENAAFNESYAVARLTPGTNLLALYTVIGYRLRGWGGAGLALTLATVLPA